MWVCLGCEFVDLSCSGLGSSGDGEGKEDSEATSPVEASELDAFKVQKGLGVAERRLKFVWMYFMSGFGLSNRMSLEFWTQLALFFVALYIRVYIHYIGTTRMHYPQFRF